MKVKHTVPVTGDLKLGMDKGFRYQGRTFHFHTDGDGFVSALSVTLQVPLDTIPKIVASQGKLESINIRSSPEEAQVFEDLRTVEGLLAFYGVHAIKIDELKSEWIPETDEERKAIAIPEFKIGKVGVRERSKEPIPFEFIAQSFVAAPLVSGVQVPLSFYRKGQIDIQQERFVDALYDFYFVFEHLYADGKYRSTQVKEAFRSSQAMRRAVSVARTEARVAFDNPTQKTYYLSKYVRATDDDVLSHIVDLRGRLHHHSVKHAGQSWHPSREREYRVDAAFWHTMGFAICFGLIKEIVFSDATVAKCKDLKAYEAVK